jgi:versiconal hemiacetal acetate esterase
VDVFYDEAGLSLEDSTYFVLLANGNHSLLPATHIISCEYDPTGADAHVLKNALQDAGVKVKHDEFEGLPHYLWMFPQSPETASLSQTLGGYRVGERLGAVVSDQYLRLRILY